MREMEIDGTRIADDTPAWVCVDIGHNHGGSLEKAKAMVRTAKASGASAVKFQTRHPKDTYAFEMYDAPFDSPHAMAPTYGEHRERLEFSLEQWNELFQFCWKEGVTALSTPFDEKSVDLLEQCQVPAYKVASGDATNIPLLRMIADLGKPMIVSTGGCTFGEVAQVVDTLRPFGVPLALLHCACIYPAKPEDLNLRAIEAMRVFPETVIGFSTHLPSWKPSIAAYAMGARIIEHHFTNDRAWMGTDNCFSLTPRMLRDLVNGLSEVHAGLGTRRKRPMDSEAAPTKERRKKLVWAKNLTQWQAIEDGDIMCMCPGNGIDPEHLDFIIGKLTSHECGKGESVAWHDIMEGVT